MPLCKINKDCDCSINGVDILYFKKDTEVELAEEAIALLGDAVSEVKKAPTKKAATKK